MTNMTSIDGAVSSFISKYETEKPRAKFHNLPYSSRRALASKYCRFVWASNVLKGRGKVNLADIKGFNAIAENALNNCNTKKLNKIANKVCSML